MGDLKNNVIAENAETLVLSHDAHHDLNGGSFSTPEKFSISESLSDLNSIPGSIKKLEADPDLQISSYMTSTPVKDINKFKANESVIIDPLQASLTWRDDEITGYDPEDPEDDGEGINGVGFRPSPAEAYIRMRKRKKQLASYRMQEAKEARRLRRERRNFCPEAKLNHTKQEKKKRVRFKEAEIINHPS